MLSMPGAHRENRCCTFVFTTTACPIGLCGCWEAIWMQLIYTITYIALPVWMPSNPEMISVMGVMVYQERCCVKVLLCIFHWSGFTKIVLVVLFDLGINIKKLYGSGMLDRYMVLWRTCPIVLCNLCATRIGAWNYFSPVCHSFLFFFGLSYPFPNFV